MPTAYPNPSHTKRLNVIYNNVEVFYNITDYPQYGIYPFWLIGDTLYGSGYWTPGMTNYISAASGQAVQDRSPTSDDAEAGDWSGATAGTRWTIADNFTWVDPPQDAVNAPTVWLTHGPTAGNITWGFSPFSVPAGRQVYALIFFFRDRGGGGGSRYYYPRLKIGGSYYNDTVFSMSPGTSWYTHIMTWRVNPRTSARWTAEDINGTGSNPLQAFGIYSPDANPTIDIGAAALRVVYEDPSTELSDGTNWIELDWHTEYTSAWPNGYPLAGDNSQENLFTEPCGTYAPYIDSERPHWIYPSPSGKIYHGTPTGGWTIQVGDLVYHVSVWQGQYETVTEVGEGWFKSTPTNGGLIYTPSTYQPYEFIRDTSWYYADILEWQSEPVERTEGTVVW